jgi:hypothetical protein
MLFQKAIDAGYRLDVPVRPDAGITGGDPAFRRNRAGFGHTHRPEAIPGQVQDEGSAGDGHNAEQRAETTPMQPFLVHSGARFQMAADYQLQRIEPPSWLNHEDIQNAPVE